MKRLGQVLGILLVVVLALALVALLLVHTPAVRKFALTKTIDVLRERNILLQAESVRYNLAQGTISLDGVVVRSALAADLPPIFTADHLEVRLDVTELLTGSYHVHSAAIRKPAIAVRFARDGRSNLPQLPAQSAPQEKTQIPDFLIEAANVSNGSFSYRDERRDISIELPAWTIAIRGETVGRKHQLQLSTTVPGKLQMASNATSIDRVELDSVLDRESLAIKQFVLNAANSSIRLDGKVNDLSAPRVDLKADLDLDSAALRHLSGYKETVVGRVSSRITVQGLLPEFVATADISSASLRYAAMPGATIRVIARYTSADRTLALDRLALSSAVGSAHASGELLLDDAYGRSHLRGQLNHADLPRILSLLGSKTVVASRVDAPFEFSWPGTHFERARGQAQVTLAPMQNSASAGRVPFEGTVLATARDGDLSISTTDLKSLGAHVIADIAATRLREIRGTVRAEIPEPRITLAQVRAFQGKSAAASVVDGAITITADLAGTLKSPQVIARLAAPSLHIGNMQGVAASADALYTPAQVDVRNADIHWRNQQASIQGTIGLAGKQKALNLNAYIKDVGVETVLTALGRPLPLTGVLNAQAVVTGTVDSPIGSVTLDAKDLNAYSEPFGRFSAKIDAAGQTIRLNSFLLEKPYADGFQRLHGDGSFDLPTKRYAFVIGGDSLTLSQLTLNDGTSVRGKVSLQGKGSGTLRDPALQVTLKADDLHVRDQEFGDIDAHLHVADQRANLKAAVPALALSSNADVGIRSPFPGRVHIVADGTDLSKLPLPRDRRPEGRVSAILDATMALSDWRAGSAALRIQPLDLRWKGQTIRSDGPIVAGYANQLVRIDSARLQAAGSTLQITGTLPVDPRKQSGDLRISGHADLAPVSALVFTDPATRATGALFLDLRLMGNLAQIRPAGTLRLQNGSFLSPALEPAVTQIALDAVADDRAINLRRLSAKWADADIVANATIPLAALPFRLPIQSRAPSLAAFTLDVNHLNLDAISAVPSKVKGMVSFRADAKASKLDPAALNGILTFRDLKLVLDELPIEQQGDSRLSITAGRARVERFLLTGPSTRFSVGGQLELTGTRQMDLNLDANADLGVLASFAEGVRAQGPARLQFHATGNYNHPDLKGFLTVENAQANLTSPPLFIDNLNLRADASGQRINVTRLAGSLNGGRLSGSGGVEIARGGIQNTDLRLSARGVFMNFPEGLRTSSDTDLRLYTEGETIVLGGQVKLLESAYTDPITLSGDAIRYLRSGQTVEFTRERNPLLAKVRFNVDVDTASPLLIDNNLAKVEATADLQLVGTYYRPSITGRISIADGGQILLNERRYVIDRAILTFLSEQRIEPALDILATTEASGYDITLRIGGEVGKTETTFTSDPVLPEPDIISVLLTGRTLEEARGSQTDVAKEQVLALLAGGATGEISAGLQRATGLSMVRVEPSLISSETEPTARLTVGQNVTRSLSLVYSMDLRDSGDQIYLAEYDFTRRFTTRAVKNSDNTYRFEFRHDLRFGGPGDDPRLHKRRKPKVASVDFEGNRLFTDDQLRDMLKIKPGKEYDFFKVRKALDGLEETYARRDLLESRFQLQRRFPQRGLVDLTLQVDPGPIVRFIFEGPVDEKVRKQIREIWQRGVFDAQRITESEQAIRNSLVKKGYLQPLVSSNVSPHGEEKQVTFEVQPGVRFHDVKLIFPGANGISPDDLKDALKTADLMEELHTEPDKVTGYLRRLYAEYGYLDAEVSPRRYELDARSQTGRLVVAVTEGPLYRVGQIRFAGNQFVSEGKLKDVVLMTPGEVYKPELRDRSFDKILDVYLEQGFRQVEIDPSLDKRAADAEVGVVFTIRENKQQIVKAIEINGTVETSQNLVHDQLAFKTGDVLAATKLTESRRKLYRTGAYFVVDVDPQPLTNVSGLQPYQMPVKMNVRVQELPAYEVRYGASYDTDRGIGGVLDLANRNTLGKARVIGFSTRSDRLLQQGRFYFSQPQLSRFPLKTDAAIYYSREEHDLFTEDRLGFTVQQESRWGNYYVYSLGYRNERARSYGTTDPSLRSTNRVAPITAALTREKRDDILDAHRGSFLSNAFEYSTGWLGSSVKFYRYFAQYSNYLPLSHPELLPFSGGVKKARFVYAASVRLGVAGGLSGQDLPPSERFFAGGGTTVRGFEQDTLGPRDANGVPTGGDAMFILNNELRFPLFKMFEGVGFVDMGNVYTRTSDFRPWDIRTTFGAGLRVRTPYILLRMDYGIKAEREPGESRGKFFISIGQAF